MNKKKNFIGLLLAGFLLLSGCAAGTEVSLEEALLAAEDKESFVTGESSFSEDTEETEAVCCVYVCGSVACPGVYTLAYGSRIVAAIEAAGGFLEEAAVEAVNLAKLVEDGMQIIVPDLTEYAMERTESARQERGQVNLNTATLEELCTLSGIGESKAEAILAYRRESGGFQNVEQLMEVTGIGENLFKQIKSSIYIE